MKVDPRETARGRKRLLVSWSQENFRELQQQVHEQHERSMMIQQSFVERRHDQRRGAGEGAGEGHRPREEKPERAAEDGE